MLCRLMITDFSGLRIELTERNWNRGALEILCGQWQWFEFFTYSFIQVRLLPATILYSNRRHSIAPLNSSVRRETERRMNFGMRKSEVNR